MGAVNCVYLLVLICYTVPCRLHGSVIAVKQLDTFISAIVESCWMVTLASLVFQSVYRYVKIKEPQKLMHLINDASVKYYVVGCFTVGFFASFPSYFPCCAIDGFTSTFIPEAVAMSTFDLSFSCLTFSLCFIFNSLTILDIVKKRKARKAPQQLIINKNKTTEIRLFYQLSCVVIVGMANTFSFNVIPRFFEDIWVFYLIDFLNILFNTIDAWVYLLLNETVREEIKKLYGCNSAKVATKHTNVISMSRIRNDTARAE